LAKELPKVEDGCITAPDTPRLGVEVNEEVIAELKVN